MGKEDPEETIILSFEVDCDGGDKFLELEPSVSNDLGHFATWVGEVVWSVKQIAADHWKSHFHCKTTHTLSSTLHTKSNPDRSGKAWHQRHTRRMAKIIFS